MRGRGYNSTRAKRFSYENEWPFSFESITDTKLPFENANGGTLFLRS